MNLFEVNPRSGPCCPPDVAAAVSSPVCKAVRARRRGGRKCHGWNGGLTIDAKAGIGRTTQAELVARLIESELVERNWPIDELLGTEDALLARYKVGRSVLREAVRILESHGVARRRPGPGGGLMVTSPRAEVIYDASRLFLDYRAVTAEDLYHTWLALETVAVRDLIARIDDDGIARLLAVRDAEAAAPFVTGRNRPNIHVEIVKQAGNPAVELFLLSVLRLVEDYSMATITAEQGAWLLRRHRRIIEAIVARDTVLAEARLERYISRLLEAGSLPGARSSSDGTAEVSRSDRWRKPQRSATRNAQGRRAVEPGRG